MAKRKCENSRWTRGPYTMQDEVNACHEAVQSIADDHMSKHKGRGCALFLYPESIPGSILRGTLSQDESVRSRASANFGAFLDPSTDHQFNRERLEIDQGWENIVATADTPMSIAENVEWGAYMRRRHASRMFERNLSEEEQEEIATG
ncbi:hypothetical protein IAT40_002597 [Kwoniella sp. CBS 6097]